MPTKHLHVLSKASYEHSVSSPPFGFVAFQRAHVQVHQQKQGLYAFKVIMDESNNPPSVVDQNQLVGQIYIQPTRTAEFISLDFILLPTGAEIPG